MIFMTAGEPLASVGDLVITKADVDGRVERIDAESPDDALPAEASPEARRLRRWVLHTLISEAVIATEAAGRGFIDDVDVSALARRGLPDATIVRVFEAVTATTSIDDDAIQRYYAANIDRYRRQETRVVRAVLTSDDRVAATIAGGARSGDGLDDAVAAARQRGDPVEGPTPLRLTRGQMTGPVEDGVFAAAPHDVVGPIGSELGWHVLRVDRIEPAATIPLAAVADDILADLLAAERGRQFDEWLGQCRADLVAVRPGNEHPGDPRAPDAIHRH